MHFAHFFCICINDYDDDYCSAKQIDGVHHLFALNLMNYYFAKEEWMCLMKILDKTLSNYIFQPLYSHGRKLWNYRFSLTLLTVLQIKYLYLLKGVLGIGWKCKWFIENIHFWCIMFATMFKCIHWTSFICLTFIMCILISKYRMCNKF